MQPGIIIAYRERGHLALGIIEKVILPPAKAQIELIGEDGKKSVLAPDRVLFESRLTAALSLPLADLKKKLQELRSQISALPKQSIYKNCGNWCEKRQTPIFRGKN